MAKLGFHDLADLFPLLDDDDLQRLADDIRENGLRESIWLYQGKILDGRNRYRACQIVGVEPSFDEFSGNDSEALKLVISLNLHRRHLTISQRAMVAAALEHFQHGGNRQDANLHVDSLNRLTASAALVGGIFYF
jgi:ParB-like chromosome segregation protein Spo0J